MSLMDLIHWGRYCNHRPDDLVSEVCAWCGERHAVPRPMPLPAVRLVAPRSLVYARRLRILLFIMGAAALVRYTGG